MDQPSNIHAETMEYAARLVEDTNISDFRLSLHCGRKRDREDNELRLKTRAELRGEMARKIRAMTGREDLSPIACLKRIATTKEGQHDLLLQEAWPLAWDGLVKIEALLVCNSNQVPPECSYRITLTDRGRAMLTATP